MTAKRRNPPPIDPLNKPDKQEWFYIRHIGPDLYVVVENPPAEDCDEWDICLVRGESAEKRAKMVCDALQALNKPVDYEAEDESKELSHSLALAEKDAEISVLRHIIEALEEVRKPIAISRECAEYHHMVVSAHLRSEATKHLRDELLDAIKGAKP